MYGDMGLTPYPGAEATVKQALMGVSTGAAFVIHQGDLSYAFGYSGIYG